MAQSYLEFTYSHTSPYSYSSLLNDYPSTINEASDITVTINGAVDTGATVDTDFHHVTTTTTLTASDTLRITRKTSATPAANFTAGAAITEKDLDLVLQQSIYLAQEALDTRNDPQLINEKSEFTGLASNAALLVVDRSVTPNEMKWSGLADIPGGGGSVTATSTTTFTNKNLTDASNTFPSNLSRTDHGHAHNATTAIQGGAAGDYQHLTTAQVAQSLEVQAATTNTLTNKTIDAGAAGNVITNIGSSEIKGNPATGIISGQTPVTSAGANDYVLIESTAGALNKIATTDISDGEANTASSVGAGVGVYKQKNGVNLEFNTLQSTDNSISLTANANGIDLKTSKLASDVTLISEAGTTHNVQDMQNYGHSAGVVDAAGGAIDNIITISSVLGSVDTQSFSVYLRGSSLTTAPITYYEVAPTTAHPITINSTQYIICSYNGGAEPTITVANSDTSSGTDSILLGIAQNIAGVIHEVINFPDRFGDHMRVMTKRHWSINGVSPEKQGLALGFNAGTLEVTVSEGAYWAKSTRFHRPAFDSNATGTIAFYYLLNGAWAETTGVSTLSTANYNDVTVQGAEALSPIPGNGRGASWFIYQGVTDGDIRAVLGTTYHSAISDATDLTKNIPPASLPAIIHPIAYKLIGHLIFQEGATTFLKAVSLLKGATTGGGFSDHNTLSNLQGGAAGDYQHLTTAELTQIQNGGAGGGIDFGSFYVAADGNLHVQSYGGANANDFNVDSNGILHVQV